MLASVTVSYMLYCSADWQTLPTTVVQLRKFIQECCHQQPNTCKTSDVVSVSTSLLTKVCM
jgi:hypothetical protein